jgi:cell wall integrity and stress response component
MSLRLFALSAILASSVFASTTLEVAATDPVLGTDTVHGCYSSIGELTLNSTNSYNSQGSCNLACRSLGKKVGATQASDCYCGDKYPAANTLVDDTDCSEPCPGYDTQACGGLDTYTVYNTGEQVDVGTEANVTSSTATTASATAVAESTSSVSLSTNAGMYFQPIID